ncbi:hypothetical protein I3843_Q000700 [Carya illinoinensis]|nr:hypothetical protein I3843_Q000700 [Carya illinoinensis]
MVFLSCEKQVNTSFYWNNSTYCFNTEVYSSTSSSSSHDMHRYVKYLDRLPYPGQVEESCRIEQISLISREGRQYIQKLLPAKRFATNCYAVLSLIGYMFLVNATDPTIATSMMRIKFNAIIVRTYAEECMLEKYATLSSSSRDLVHDLNYFYLF